MVDWDGFARQPEVESSLDRPALESRRRWSRPSAETRSERQACMTVQATVKWFNAREAAVADCISHSECGVRTMVRCI